MYTKYPPPCAKVYTVSHYDWVFTKYKVFNNWPWIEWPHTHLDNLTIKSALYTLNTHSRGPKFRSTTGHFQNTRLWEIESAPVYQPVSSIIPEIISWISLKCRLPCAIDLDDIWIFGKKKSFWQFSRFLSSSFTWDSRSKILKHYSSSKSHSVSLLKYLNSLHKVLFWDFFKIKFQSGILT